MSNDSSALTAYEPQSLEQAIKVSEMLSKSGLVPRALQGKPTDILLVMWKGRELGLSTIQSLGSIDIIEGKAVMSAELQVALCVRRADICEYFSLVETSKTRAVYETKRRGAPKSVTLDWTIEQAKEANFLAKDNWRKHPAAMLRWRASSALAKAVYPELVLGIYTPDEAEEIRSGTAPAPLPPPEPTEKEVNAAPVEPPPEPPPPKKKPTRTEQLKKQLQVVDVQPGESEQQATERTNGNGNGRDPALRTRGAKLWSAAQAVGDDVVHFQLWCAHVLGVSKSAKEMTAEDLTKLEDAFAERIGEDQAS